MPFKLHTPYPPAGDQPDAIRQLTEGILNGEKYQTLLGVTGMLFRTFNGQHLFLLIIKHWWHSFMVNSNNFFRKMQWDILFPITITINRKLIYR